MAQYARPNSTINNDGGWVPTGAATLHDAINSVSINDSTYIGSPGTASGGASVLGLSSVGDPQSSSGHVVRYRVRRTATNRNWTVIVILEQGSTVIAMWETVNPGTAFETVVQTLTTQQADNITDYSDLRLTVNNTVAQAGTIGYLSWAELEVPDAAPPATPISPDNLVSSTELTQPIQASLPLFNNFDNAVAESNVTVENSALNGDGFDAVLLSQYLHYDTDTYNSQGHSMREGPVHYQSAASVWWADKLALFVPWPEIHVQLKFKHNLDPLLDIYETYDAEESIVFDGDTGVFDHFGLALQIDWQDPTGYKLSSVGPTLGTVLSDFFVPANQWLLLDIVIIPATQAELQDGTLTVRMYLDPTANPELDPPDGVYESICGITNQFNGTSFGHGGGTLDQPNQYRWYDDVFINNQALEYWVLRADPNNVVSTTELTQPTITSAHNLQPDNLVSGSDLAESELLQAGDIGPDNIASTTELSQPTVVESSTGPTWGLGSPLRHIEVVAVVGQIQPDNLVSSTELTASTLTQKHTLQPESLISGSVASTSMISQAHYLVGSNLASTTTLTEPNVLQSGALSGEALGSPTALSQPSISQRHSVVPLALESGSLATPAALVQAHALDPASLSSATEVTASSLTQAHTLYADDLYSNSTLTEISISSAGQTSADDIFSSTQLTASTITQKHTIVPEDLLSASVATQPGISTHTFLTVDNLTSSTVLPSGSVIEEGERISLGIVPAYAILDDHIATSLLDLTTPNLADLDSHFAVASLDLQNTRGANLDQHYATVKLDSHTNDVTLDPWDY